MHIRVHAGSSQNRSAPGQDAPHRVAVERPGPPLHQPFPSVENTDHLGFVTLGSPGHEGANRRVEPRTVAAGGEDSDHSAHGDLSGWLSTGTWVCRSRDGPWPGSS